MHIISTISNYPNISKSVLRQKFSWDSLNNLRNMTEKELLIEERRKQRELMDSKDEDIVHGMKISKKIKEN
jgi:hypothetical protein